MISFSDFRVVDHCRPQDWIGNDLCLAHIPGILTGAIEEHHLHAPVKDLLHLKFRIHSIQFVNNKLCAKLINGCGIVIIKLGNLEAMNKHITPESRENKRAIEFVQKCGRNNRKLLLPDRGFPWYETPDVTEPSPVLLLLT